jgi:hypothetical protein
MRGGPSKGLPFFGDTGRDGDVGGAAGLAPDGGGSSWGAAGQVEGGRREERQLPSRTDPSSRDMVIGKTLRGTLCGNADDGGRPASERRRLVDGAASCEVGEGEHHE